MPFRRGQLRYFVTVADEGQITRAARKLHLAQPSLSQAIAQLESEVGFRLLERHTHGVTLTLAGREFYEKARMVVAADMDAERTAKALARAEQGVVHFGFLGAPPGLDSPARLEEFASRYPDIDICYREIPFPSTPIAAWLAEVDVAVCHLPPPEPDVWAHAIRREPRVVLAPARHHLAKREELSVEELLGETYIGFHPSIDQDWAGFWSLDDHRAGPPARVTSDHASNPQEVLAALAMRQAITTVPASVAAVIANTSTGLTAIPLRDAAPATIALVGHTDFRNPLVKALLEFAREP